MLTEETLLGALFQRREPHGGLHGAFGPLANDPSGQTAQAGMSRAPPSVYRHRREGLPLGTSPRGCSGSPWESLRKPRRKSGHEEDTSPWKERAIRHSQGCRTQRTRSQRNASKSRISPDTSLLPPTSNGEQKGERPG